jgi:hypothetical protein
MVSDAIRLLGCLIALWELLDATAKKDRRR